MKNDCKRIRDASIYTMVPLVAVVGRAANTKSAVDDFVK